MRDYIALTKPRITWLILMSTGIGYFFGLSSRWRMARISGRHSVVLAAEYDCRNGADRLRHRRAESVVRARGAIAECGARRIVRCLPAA